MDQRSGRPRRAFQTIQGRLLARYDADAAPLPSPINKQRASSAQQRLASTKKLSGALHRTAGANPESIVFRPRSRSQRGATGEKLFIKAPANKTIID